MAEQKFGTHVPAIVRQLNGGVQHEFKFDNGYGASVVCGAYTYGGPAGLWELAVLSRNGRLNYETPITDDVLGYLTPAEVTAALDQIAALEPAEVWA